MCLCTVMAAPDHYVETAAQQVLVTTLWAVRWYRYEPFTAIAMCTMASVHESTRGTKGSFEVDDTSSPNHGNKLKSKSNPKTSNHGGGSGNQ